MSNAAASTRARMGTGRVMLAILGEVASIPFREPLTGLAWRPARTLSRRERAVVFEAESGDVLRGVAALAFLAALIVFSLAVGGAFPVERPSSLVALFCAPILVMARAVTLVMGARTAVSIGIDELVVERFCRAPVALRLAEVLTVLVRNERPPRMELTLRSGQVVSVKLALGLADVARIAAEIQTRIDARSAPPYRVDASVAPAMRVDPLSDEQPVSPAEQAARRA